MVGLAPGRFGHRYTLLAVNRQRRKEDQCPKEVNTPSASHTDYNAGVLLTLGNTHMRSLHTGLNDNV